MNQSKSLESKLANRGIVRRKAWIKAWSEGLAFCYHCDHEYTDAQVIIHLDEKSCPKCKNPERKTYYYCKEHGSANDDCER